MLNAIDALFYYEDIRIYRDHKNMTNRLNNMEQANVDKSIETAARQVKEIEKIQEHFGDCKMKIELFNYLNYFVKRG